jgi:thiol-disulfide isomerase/thioredoxin
VSRAIASARLSSRWFLVGLLAAFGPLSGAAAQAQEVGVITPAGIRALVGAGESRVVVVNFWATWCPPCLREFPDIIEVYEDYREHGLDVFAVSMNEADEAEDIAEFLENFAPPFPIYRAATIDETFYEGVLDSWFGEMPMTLIFDADGELLHIHKKPVTYDELAGQIAPLLP